MIPNKPDFEAAIYVVEETLREEREEGIPKTIPAWRNVAMCYKRLLERDEQFQAACQYLRTMAGALPEDDSWAQSVRVFLEGVDGACE